MYFWKIEQLKEDIKSNRLSEKDRFIYTFIYIALGAIAMESMIWMPLENPNTLDSIDSFLNIIITCLGTYFSYKANGGASGVDFLGRFFSISFVVGIRFVVLLIPMYIAIFAYYYYVYPIDQELETTAFDIIIYQAWFIFLYVRTYKHIRDVKNS